MEIELSRIPGTAEDAKSDERRLDEQDFGPTQSNETSNLPPADRGRAAYLFLFACFMIEALVWGFPFSFGIFQEYYTRAFAGQSNIAIVGACCTVRVTTMR